MITKLVINTLQVHPLVAGDLAWKWVTRVDGLGTPEPRKDAYTAPRRHGLVDFTKYYEGRVLDITGIIASSHVGTNGDIMLALDALKMASRLTGSDFKVLFRREGMNEDEFVMARAHGAVEAELRPRQHGALEWGIQLVASDPRMYSDVLKTVSYDPSDTASGFGLTFPLDFPLVFGAPSESSVSVHNQGTVDTPLEFTVDGPADAGFQIINLTTGHTIQTQNIALTADDALVIDTGRRTCVLNGVNRPDLIEGGETIWFTGEPGVTPVALQGGGFLDNTTLLTVKYRDARI